MTFFIVRRLFRASRWFNRINLTEIQGFPQNMTRVLNLSLSRLWTVLIVWCQNRNWFWTDLKSRSPSLIRTLQRPCVSALRSSTKRFCGFPFLSLKNCLSAPNHIILDHFRAINRIWANMMRFSRKCCSLKETSHLVWTIGAQRAIGFIESPLVWAMGLTQNFWVVHQSSSKVESSFFGLFLDRDHFHWFRFQSQFILITN